MSRKKKNTPKRTDSKGRLLRTGEGQRKDGTYDYRYTDKDHVRYSTQTGYRFVQSVIKKYEFGQQRIRNIKVSDAKEWLIQLFDDGYSWSTIASIRGVLRPAFQMAFSEEIIRRNPFDFRLDFLPNNTQKRVALTEKQQKQFLDFVAQDDHFCRYLDEFVVLMGTGMRVSEFCGLTISDLDFENRRIRVDHQFSWDRSCKRYIEKTKTEAGCHFIPMNDDVLRSLYNILANRPRPKKEWMIDGYTHTEYGKAQEAMSRICSFMDIQLPGTTQRLRRLG